MSKYKNTHPESTVVILNPNVKERDLRATEAWREFGSKADKTETTVTIYLKEGHSHRGNLKQTGNAYYHDDKGFHHLLRTKHGGVVTGLLYTAYDYPDSIVDNVT